MSPKEESRETTGKSGVTNFLEDFCFRTPAGFITLLAILGAIVACIAIRSNRDMQIERAKQGIVREYYTDGRLTQERWIKVQ